MFRKSFTRNRGFRPKFGANRGTGVGAASSSFIHSSKYVKKAVPQQEVDAPIITNKFSDFPIDQQLKDNIITRGYVTPTPIQDQAMPHVLAGRDVIGIANTGTGKTAAFLVPSINKIMADRTQRVLIIVPTRELAVQIEDELKAFTKSINIFSVLCMGGLSVHPQVSMLRRNPHIVIGTPGRLKDLIERRVLHLQAFQTIVLDEVDRMVDIGFIHDIKFIVARLPHKRQSLFFSATITPEINSIMQTFLTDPITISVKRTETSQNVDQDVIRITDRNKKAEKLSELLKQEDFKKVLIFGRTKWNVERLAKALEREGFSVASIHGNKSQNQRLRALEQFKNNQIKIMVATDIAARGLDIDDVTHVINYDEPANYTEYVHRIGRTGRANKSGKALTFVG